MTESVRLSDLANGAACELFDAELARVAYNIIDPNTDAKAVREITLKVRIKPTEDREMGDVTVICQAKLAGLRPAASRMFFGRVEGKLVAIESEDPRQAGLFDGPKAKVTPLGGKGEK